MKNILLVLMIVLGVLFPYGHEYAFLIRYILMLLLIFAFLDIGINKNIIQRSHFVILAVNILFPIAIFFIINPINETLATAAFITAITPTAIASPVVTSILKGKVEYVVFSLLLTNIVIALLIPFLIPLLLDGNSNISVGQLLFPVLTVFLIPFVFAQSFKYFTPKFHGYLLKHRDSSFYLLAVSVYLATAKAVHYIGTELNASINIVFYIGIATFIICAINFLLGKFLGGKEYNQEGAQSLGQKNNAFTIWISLTFLNPVVALGPTFYVLAHNLVISGQLYWLRKRTLNDKGQT